MERKEVTRMLVGVQPQGQGTIRVVGAKLHGIVVTESKLNYHGSITIDTDILEAARLLPLEYVYIWNKHSGSRIETYVLPGPRGSGVVCLNGAAARTCQVGDEIIVASSREIPVSDYHDGFSCRVLTFDQSGELPNRVAEKLEYRVAAKDDGTEFVIMDMATGQEWIGETYRSDMRGKGPPLLAHGAPRRNGTAPAAKRPFPSSLFPFKDCPQGA